MEGRVIFKADSFMLMRENEACTNRRRRNF